MNVNQFHVNIPEHAWKGQTKVSTCYQHQKKSICQQSSLRNSTMKTPAATSASAFRERKERIAKSVSLINESTLFLDNDFLCLDINECDSNPCSKYGNCIDGIGNYSCECEPGFKGVHCDVSYSKLFLLKSQVWLMNY